MRGSLAVAAGFVVLWLATSLGTAAQAAPQKLAWFGFRLINTSLEATTDIENGRIAALDRQLVDDLRPSGRYTFVEIPAAATKRLAEQPPVGECNGCEQDAAKAAGATLAAWGSVQKVSNLILNINLFIEDSATGRTVLVKSVDIRGNTDESWHHGLSYLIRHYVLDEP